jgi:hypothetical protein
VGTAVTAVILYAESVTAAKTAFMLLSIVGLQPKESEQAWAEGLAPARPAPARTGRGLFPFHWTKGQYRPALRSERVSAQTSGLAALCPPEFDKEIS